MVVPQGFVRVCADQVSCRLCWCRWWNRKARGPTVVLNVFIYMDIYPYADLVVFSPIRLGVL